MYGTFQAKIMHCTSGISNQLKWPINNDEIWYEKVVWKIAPPEPIHSGRCTGVTTFLMYFSNIEMLIFLVTLIIYLSKFMISCPFFKNLQKPNAFLLYRTWIFELEPFFIWIHYMQGWIATTKHGVTRKRST